MNQFSGVLRWLEQIKADGVIQDYAIGGAVAASVWGEVLYTQDLDVPVVVAPGTHAALDPLRPILDWLASRGYVLEGEHVIVEDVPVQLLPAWHPLVTEAIRHAVAIPYDPDDPAAPPMRLITATYLVAMWRLPGASSASRAQRAARLTEAGVVDEALLSDLMARYRL